MRPAPCRDQVLPAANAKMDKLVDLLGGMEGTPLEPSTLINAFVIDMGNFALYKEDPKQVCL